MTENIVEILEAVARGTLSVKDLLATHGGRQWYVPTGYPQTIAERNAAIYAAWTGANMREIQRQWPLSVRQIQKIVKDQLSRRQHAA